MVIPCDLPAGLDLLTASDQVEIYQWLSATPPGDSAQIWVQHAEGTLYVNNCGTPHIPFDIMKYLIDRGLADEGRTDATGG